MKRPVPQRLEKLVRLVILRGEAYRYEYLVEHISRRRRLVSKYHHGLKQARLGQVELNFKDKLSTVITIPAEEAKASRDLQRAVQRHADRLL